MAVEKSGFHRDQHPDGTNQKRLISRGREIAERIPTMAPGQTRAMVIALLVRVDLMADRVEIKMRRRSLVELLHAQPTEPIIHRGTSDTESDDILTLKVRGTPTARRPRDANAGGERATTRLWLMQVYSESSLERTTSKAA